jgi:AbiV family abortive infection protein
VTPVNIKAECLLAQVMLDLKLSTRKLNALQYACFQNALRLHFDSVLLVKVRSFASAFAISVIASEEFGKAFGIAEIIFQAGFDKGRFHAEDTKFVRALLSDHKLKQGWFVSSFFDIFGRKDVFRRYQNIQSVKNDAIYAGVRKGNHQIVRPFLISASKAKQQIRTVNNALIDSVEGTLNGTYCYEDVAQQVFRSRRLLDKLMRAAKTVR